MCKIVADGVQDFQELIDGNGYFVDKTPLLRTLFSNDGDDVTGMGKVRLITRPRRFGKTLTLSMCYNFLALNSDSPGDLSLQKRLFAGTKILEDQEFCNRYMGRFPVIFFTLKGVEDDNYEQAYTMLVQVVCNLAMSFRYLNGSDKLSDEQKSLLANLRNYSFLIKPENKALLADSLHLLIEMLYIHHGVKPIVLIDEYDVPLATARAGGFYDKMVVLIRNFLSNALKSVPEHFYKAVLTGCLRVSKESIFTGLNNLKVNTVFDDDPRLNSALGFTKAETMEMLGYFGLEKYADLVRENYDGYRFGNTEIFCPWDASCFCDYALNQVKYHAEVIAKTYWIDTSGNDVIKEFMEFIGPEESEIMQRLVDGGTQTLTLNPILNYADLSEHRIADFWTMLVYSGYLTVLSGPPDGDTGEYEVRIPNLEIRKCFHRRISDFYNTASSYKGGAFKVLQAVFAGDVQSLQFELEDLLSNYVSVRDFATKAAPENYYHGFLNGLLSHCGQAKKLKNYRTNAEAGRGYLDIAFKSYDMRRIGIILEVKSVSSEERMEEQAEAALEQIGNKNYTAMFGKNSVATVLGYGICFCGKSCAVKFKKLA